MASHPDSQTMMSHRRRGTVGPKSFAFINLDNEPAADVLLKTAVRPEPWDLTTREMAATITRRLGCLPLALVYAGKAML